MSACGDDSRPTPCASAAPRLSRNAVQVEARHITNFRADTRPRSGVGCTRLLDPTQPISPPRSQPLSDCTMRLLCLLCSKSEEEARIWRPMIAILSACRSSPLSEPIVDGAILRMQRPNRVTPTTLADFPPCRWGRGPKAGRDSCADRLFDPPCTLVFSTNRSPLPARSLRVAGVRSSCAQRTRDLWPTSRRLAPQPGMHTLCATFQPLGRAVDCSRLLFFFDFLELV